MAEERTTQEERNHIMEARKRAANKRRKLRSMGKSKSTETEEDDDDADEGKTQGNYEIFKTIFIPHLSSYDL